MATSSKVQFKLETLREKALEALDEQLRLAQLELDSYENEEAWAARVTEWRKVQEKKLSDLFARLGEDEHGRQRVSDYQLSKFKLDRFPELDRYDIQRASNALRHLQAKRTQVLAKSESLVADQDGNIALTKTQLAEFFAL